MSQTTEIQIANQSGLLFRQALNQMLSGLDTDMAGVSAPTVTEPYMGWLDTSTTPPTPRRRNSTDTGWNVDAVPAAGGTFLGAIAGITAASGDNSNTYATTAFVDNALSGVATIPVTNANVTLTQAQYGAGQLKITGVLTANVSLVLPQAVGFWSVENSTTGNFNVTLTMTTGTTVQPPQGKTTIVCSDSVNLSLAGSSGAQGGGSDAVFYLNGQTVNNSYTIPTGQNAFSAGPITVAASAVVTVSSGSNWTVV